MVCWGFGYARIFSKNYVDGVGPDTRKVIYKLLMYLLLIDTVNVLGLEDFLSLKFLFGARWVFNKLFP